jgi:hypothetical protein
MKQKKYIADGTDKPMCKSYRNGLVLNITLRDDRTAAPNAAVA